MQIRHSPASASLALGLMFLALVVIYLVVPQTDIVTTISVLILVLTLIMGLVGDPGDIRVMTGVAALTSLVAAAFLGDAWLGVAGRVLLPALWFLVLYWAFRRLRANTLVIPEDHAVMYAPFLSSQVYQVDPGQTAPVTALDRHVATIPLYELTLDTKIENVNTRAFHNVDMIEAHVRYRVADPARALVGIPNRGKIQNDVAREMGQPLARAQLDPAFWERLLAKQMGAEVDDIVRAVVFNLAEAGPRPPLRDKAGEVLKEDSPEAKLMRGTLLEAYLDRRVFSEAVLRELQVLVRRWGVTVTQLDLDLYKLDRELVGRLTENVDRRLAREQKEKQAEATNDAFYVETVSKKEIEAEAERLSALIAALRAELDRDLPPKVLEELLVTAIRAASENPLREIIYPGLFDENRSEKPPGGGGGSNGAKK
ncbi:MAG TPA: SPFH domain-containing protein [Roseiflexaceae bacterium]|nr:SPFH domain-containing protein [Roseiflexaceae bacterium]